jgi:hypothetical protein
MNTNSLIVTCAPDYLHLCEVAGIAPLNPEDLADAARHASFSRALHDFVKNFAGEYRINLPFPVRPPLFTLQLNHLTSAEEIVRVLRSDGHTISEDAMSMVMNPNFRFYPGHDFFEFIPATVKDVTGRDRVTNPELCSAMLAQSWIPAPHPAAFAIRLKYVDQPLHQYESLIGEPLPDSNNSWSTFSLRRCNTKAYSVERFIIERSRMWMGDDRLLLCRIKCTP